MLVHSYTADIHRLEWDSWLATVLGQPVLFNKICSDSRWNLDSKNRGLLSTKKKERLIVFKFKVLYVI